MANMPRSIPVMPGEPDSSVEATGVRRRWLRTFDSLALPPYRRYFTAMLFYFGAMQATVLVRPILAFELADRQPIVLGIAIAANNAPSLLLSPFAGALADKVSMRNILMVAAVLMALFAGITAVGVALDVVDWWHVTIIGVFQGSVMVFITPTRRAIIGGLVDESHLLNATGLHTMSQNANRVFLPLLAGFLFARYGAEWAYVLIVGMYLVAIVLMFAVPVRGAGASRSRRRSGSPLEGFRYVKQEPAIRNLLLVGLVITVFGQPFQHLLPLAQEFLMIEAGRHRPACSRSSAWGRCLGPRQRLRWGTSGARGCCSWGSSRCSAWALWDSRRRAGTCCRCCLMLPVGIGHSGRTVVHLATLQAYSDAEMRGRVQALNAMMGGLIPIAVLGITGLAELFGGRVALASAGSVIVAYGIWETLFSKTLRNLR